jgi:Galactose oxidase, central domain
MAWKSILWFIPCLMMAQSSGTFTSTGSMTMARFGHSATLLADGRVLIAGGYTDAWNPMPYPLDGHAVTATAEIYDPSTGAFTSTGSMVTPRAYHTATLLPDGRVLIASGRGGGSDDNLATAELYDPATGLFTATGSMTTPSGHDVNTATLLPDGRVLITGAPVVNGGPFRAELYDASRGVFTPAATSTKPPSFATATLLPSGQVLLASAFSSELYDPATGIFSPTATLNTFGTQAGLLANGTVLITGGNDDPGPTAKAFLYDPSAATFTAVGSMTAPRSNLTLSALPDGRALITGGSTWTGFSLPGGQQAMAYTCCLASAEIYDPSTGLFTAAVSMAAPRAGHTATLLSSGQILIAGGGSGDNGPAIATAELYTP